MVVGDVDWLIGWLVIPMLFFMGAGFTYCGWNGMVMSVSRLGNRACVRV